MTGKTRLFLAGLLVTMLMVANLPARAGDDVQPDQTFWKTIRDTTLPELFEMFLRRYPESVYRREAEQKLQALRGNAGHGALRQADQLTRQIPEKSIPAPTVDRQGQAAGTRAPALAAPVMAVAPASPGSSYPIEAPAVPSASGQQQFPEPDTRKSAALSPDDHPRGTQQVTQDTIILIQHNLNRVGCTVGKLDGKWGSKTQASASRFARTVELPLVTAMPNNDLLTVLKTYEEGTCAPLIKAGPKAKRWKKTRIRPAARKRSKKYRVRRKIKTTRKKVVVKRKVVQKKKRKVTKKRVVRKKVKTAHVSGSHKKKRVVRRKKRKSNSIPKDDALSVFRAGVATSAAFGRRGRGGSNGGGGQFSVRRK